MSIASENQTRDVTIRLHRVRDCESGEQFWIDDWAVGDPAPEMLISWHRWDHGHGERSTPRPHLLLGWGPRPETLWEGFRHDIGHGLLMQYPLVDVLVFAIRAAWRTK